MVETTENDSQEFLDAIPGMVDRAQNRICRDLDTYGFVVYTTVTAVSGSPFIDRPVSALATKHLYRLSGTRRTAMTLRTDEFINEYWPDRTSVGVPKYYANWGFTQFLVAPAPSGDTFFELSMIATPVTLNSTTSTNWVTNYAPELLFFACMVEANFFMKNWGAAQMWDGRYEKSADRLRNEARKTRRDDQANPGSPAGGDQLNDWSV
jgi:hypothetical protein